MVGLTLSLLGPFEVTRNGKPVPWSGGDATRALLGYLAMHADRNTSANVGLRREVLAGLLWPDVPQAAALANLRQAIHRLRTSIGDSESDLPCLHVTRQTIACHPPTAQSPEDGGFWLDVAAFRAALDAVDTHPHHRLGSCTSCTRRLQDAVALYRGEFMAGFSYPSDLYEGWMVVERETLHGQALQALARLADAYGARGRYEEAICAARRQVELEPWREVAHRQWMRALVARGQRGAALAQYEACRRILQQELGLEPEQETAALYERIRAGRAGLQRRAGPDGAAAPGGPGTPVSSGDPIPSGGPIPAGTGPPDGHLPVPATPFIGRQVQVAQAIDLLTRADVRLLTLTGAGGTGKTRLALELGVRLQPDYPEGVFFVPLASLRDPAYVVPAIARVLGVRETEGQPLMESVRYYVRDRWLLLVLDNFEHLLAAAPVVSELLAAAPALKVLVTSRAPLRVYGEHEYSVPPMEVPTPRALPSLERLAQAEAVQLFAQRARAVRPDFVLDEGNAQDVAEICARLDGLPLAIELAAARVKLLSPQAILPRLGERLQFLTGGPRDLPARQRTLRATIDWSYDLLDAAERTLLHRLSVFAGGCTVQAVEAVCLDPPCQPRDKVGVRQLCLSAGAGPALDLLQSLVDQSLLEHTQVAGEPRFSMLETIRAYAAERLAESGEEEAVRRRHAAFYLGLAQKAEPALHRYGVEQAAWMDRLEREQDNLRAALAWSLTGADVELGLRLCLALGRFWEVGLWHDQGREWLAMAAAASAGKEDWKSLRAGVLNWAGTLAVYSDGRAAAALQEESLALWRETGDARGIGYTLCELGITDYMLGDLDRARSRMEAGIAMLREAQDTLSLARALYWYALIPLSEGDLESARTHARESARLSRQIGALAHTATTIRVLGYIAEAQEDYAAARAAYEEDLRLARQARDRLCIEQCLGELGGVAYRQGDEEGAQGYWHEALGLYRSSGNRRATANTVLALGGMALYQGDDPGAEPLLDEGLALARELADSPLLAYALHERGQWALDRGNRSYAIALLSEGLDVSQEIEHHYLLPVCLAGLAAAKGDGGARAIRLFGAAQALLEATDTHLDRGDQAVYDRNLAAVRAGLDEAAYTRAWAEGREMAAQGAARVVAYARGAAPADT